MCPSCPLCWKGRTELTKRNRSNRSADRPHAESAASLVQRVQRVHHLDRADAAAAHTAHADQRLQNQADRLAQRAGLDAELRDPHYAFAVPEAEESLGDQSGYRRGSEAKRGDRLPDHSLDGLAG